MNTRPGFSTADAEVEETVEVPAYGTFVVVDGEAHEFGTAEAQPRMTGRQEIAWAEAVADIRSRGVEVSENRHSHGWDLIWRQESRPGRGHDLHAIWCDGEHLVQLIIRVYGEWSVGIAEVDWIHSSSDEACGCDRCEAELLEDDDEIDGREVVDVVVAGGVL